MKTYFVFGIISTCQAISMNQPIVQANTLDPSQFVNPVGYPFNVYDYLDVIDSFLIGFNMYTLFPNVSKNCLNQVRVIIPVMNYTFRAWTAFYTNDEYIKQNKTIQYSIFTATLDTQIYNLTQVVSGQFSPLYRNCGLFLV